MALPDTQDFEVPTVDDFISRQDQQQYDLDGVYAKLAEFDQMVKRADIARRDAVALVVADAVEVAKFGRHVLDTLPEVAQDGN